MGCKSWAKGHHLLLSLNLACYVAVVVIAALSCDTYAAQAPPPTSGGAPATPSGSPSPSVGSSGGSSSTPPRSGGGGGTTVERCPRDTLKLGVCANLVGGLARVVIGEPHLARKRCCGLVAGLVDMEAAVCLCTAIKANILGINLDIPLTLTLLLNVCGITPPPDFTC